jgi:hypothetical protein
VLRKIDVRDIVFNHYKSLRDNRLKRASRVKDAILFYVFPALLATILTMAGLRLGKTEALLAAVAILGAFLFALLILVLQMSVDAAARTEEDRGPSSRTLKRVKVLRELSANVAYSVLVSVLTTASLAIGNLVLPPTRAPVPGGIVRDPQQPWWISSISVFLSAHLGLTLLMVLRRTYAITQRELDFASVRKDRDRVA